MEFPTNEEHSPFFSTYVNHLPERDPLLLLEQTEHYAEHILNQIPADLWDYAYAPGKWTPKQVLSHMIDTEHILSYRALRFARNDNESALPFDQDAYVDATPSETLDWEALRMGWRRIRSYTRWQFGQYEGRMEVKGGSSHFPNTVRAVAAILSGHALNHLLVLQERYLKLEPLALDAFLAAQA